MNTERGEWNIDERDADVDERYEWYGWTMLGNDTKVQRVNNLT